LSQLDPLVKGRLLRSQTAAALNEANQLFSTGRAVEAKQKLSSRLAKLESERKVALQAAPAPRRAKLKADLDKQATALGEANSGFASPPPAAAALPTEETRRGRAQVKQNAQVATDLAF
jgi:Ca-activated chloride channel family protein